MAFHGIEISIDDYNLNMTLYLCIVATLRNLQKLAVQLLLQHVQL